MACNGLKELLSNANWSDGRYLNQPAHLGNMMTSLGINVMSYCYDNIYMMAFVYEHGRQCMSCSAKFSMTIQTEYRVSQKNVDLF